MGKEMIPIWFPGFYTEAHREVAHQDGLADALRAEGFDPSRTVGDDCRLGFVGGSLKYHEYREGLQVFRRRGVPYVFYCWDLYPWKMEKPYDPKNNY